MYLNKVSKLLNLLFMALGFETTKSQVVYVNEWKRENLNSFYWGFGGLQIHIDQSYV